MKLYKNENGKQIIKMSKQEWETIGNKSGWKKEAQIFTDGNDQRYYINAIVEKRLKTIDSIVLRAKRAKTVSEIKTDLEQIIDVAQKTINEISKAVKINNPDSRINQGMGLPETPKDTPSLEDKGNSLGSYGS